MKLYEMLPKSLYTSSKLEARHLTEILNNRLGVMSFRTKPDPVLEKKLDFYMHHPLPDGRLTVPVLERVWTAVADARRYINKGGRLVIHCNAGRNRAGLIAALLIRDATGVSGAEALEQVRRIRPNAVANPHFEEYLLGLTRAGTIDDYDC